MKLRIQSDARKSTLWARITPGPHGRLSRTLRFGLLREFLEHVDDDPTRPQPNVGYKSRIYARDFDPPIPLRDAIETIAPSSICAVSLEPIVDLSLCTYEIAEITNCARSRGESPSEFYYLGECELLEKDKLEENILNYKEKLRKSP